MKVSEKDRLEFRLTRILDWPNVYEGDVHLLESDGNEETNLSPERSFYLNRPTSIEKSSGRQTIRLSEEIEPFIRVEEPSRSPTFHSQFDSNSNKPKWEIRLPQLLNSTVGPDRQVTLFISHLFSIYSAFI